MLARRKGKGYGSKSQLIKKLKRCLDSHLASRKETGKPGNLQKAPSAILTLEEWISWSSCVTQSNSVSDAEYSAVHQRDVFYNKDGGSSSRVQLEPSKKPVINTQPTSDSTASRSQLLQRALPASSPKNPASTSMTKGHRSHETSILVSSSKHESDKQSGPTKLLSQLQTVFVSAAVKVPGHKRLANLKRLTTKGNLGRSSA